VEPNVKSIAPNIALMKWSRWCEINGHEYQYVRGIVEPKIKPDVILMSCMFSYNSKHYEELIDHYLYNTRATVYVGGVFPTLNPKWFNKLKWNNHPWFEDRLKIHQGIHNDIERLIPKYDVEIDGELPYVRDRIVLYSSRGCTNKCGYCGVPKLEGAMKSFRSIREQLETGRQELPDAKGVVLLDNNFTEHEYFNEICDELKDFGLPIDIMGLHVGAFTRDHAKKLAELKWGAQQDKGTSYIRFSFDKLSYTEHIERAFKYFVGAGIKTNFFAYMLFNWIDSPADFWRRIEICQEIVDKYGKTLYLFPQRYEPFMSLKRNSYIGKHWTESQVRNLVNLYTDGLRGFIAINRPRGVYKHIGRTYEEFLERIYK
jgi:hypothetical protein